MAALMGSYDRPMSGGDLNKMIIFSSNLFSLQANCSLQLEGTTQHHRVSLPTVPLHLSYTNQIRETERQMKMMQRYSRYPQTTTGAVGWDKSKLGEKSWKWFGSRKRGKLSISKLLNQPEPDLIQRTMP